MGPDVPTRGRTGFTRPPPDEAKGDEENGRERRENDPEPDGRHRSLRAFRPISLGQNWRIAPILPRDVRKG